MSKNSGLENIFFFQRVQGPFWPFRVLSHLGGYSELFRKSTVQVRKLAQWWQTKAGMCSPDAQDSKKCWVGYPVSTLWGSAGPKAKISEPLPLGNFGVKIGHFGVKWQNPGFWAWKSA